MKKFITIIAILFSFHSLQACELENLHDCPFSAECTSRSTPEELEAIGFLRGIPKAYRSIHRGALHNPRFISPKAEAIQLEDGSLWIVHPAHRNTLFDWTADDSLILLENHDAHSSFPFVLANRTTGSSIEVSFSSLTGQGKENHLWIEDIDTENKTISLNDRSVWSIANFDAIEGRWQIDDPLIIGVHQSFIVFDHENLLFNANLQEDQKATCHFLFQE